MYCLFSTKTIRIFNIKKIDYMSPDRAGGQVHHTKDGCRRDVPPGQRQQRQEQGRPAQACAVQPYGPAGQQVSRLSNFFSPDFFTL